MGERNTGDEPEQREYPQVIPGAWLPDADHWIGGTADRDRVRRRQDWQLLVLRWLARALAVLAVAAVAVLVVSVQPASPRVTDAELAGEISGAVGTLNGHPVTAADVPEIVGFVCSDNPADRAGYPAAVVSIVRAAGRCGR